jgi:hypothetical protein
MTKIRSIKLTIVALVESEVIQLSTKSLNRLVNYQSIRTEVRPNLLLLPLTGKRPRASPRLKELSPTLRELLTKIQERNYSEEAMKKDSMDYVKVNKHL